MGLSTITSMRRNKQHVIGVLILLLALLSQQEVIGQVKSTYSNKWINYAKPYVKIGINKKGLHKVSMSLLPKEFSAAATDKLQLWHRGREVSIISVSNNEILFFAVPNDGASDSLLYRPMSSRMNPYFSMYSDEGSYFLTIGDTAGLRAKTVNEAVNMSTPPIAAHDELAVTVFQTDYSLSTQNPIRPNFFNSFFELGASRTGKVQLPNTVLTNEFTLKNLVGDVENVRIKLLVHGRSNNDRSIEVYVGKTAESFRKVTAIANTGFAGSEYTFSLSKADVNDAGKGILGLKSISTNKSDRFSLAYYSVALSQAVDMTSQVTKEFKLKSDNTGPSRLQIKGLPAKGSLLDISDLDAPSVIGGSGENFMLKSVKGKTLTLFASNEVTNVVAAKIKALNLSVIETKQPNYVIITTESLYQGATQYAAYRSSTAGGGFKPVILKITDLYDQFNYGEPSPLAIRNFMTYMLGEGGKDKYLFLIGKSITHNERMKRELPDEVPTIGYPASDLLLVEGLAGTSAEQPAVPVGRLSALSNQNVLDYLVKVKEYEQNAIGDYGWRKNFLHLNGGKNTGEITQLKDLLNDLVPSVADGVVGGKVKPFVKQQPIAEVEPVNITSDVNAGVGLITYFGHGSPIVTDLDMGYITDVARGYNNFQKYPMMYFNGCGVGNIFSARFNTNPNSTSDRITLSLDWLLAPDRGSVAIIANSFESFVSPSSEYLKQLYKSMFVDAATVNLSIGKIQQAVANAILSQTKDKYTVANVHQSLLQGDPALKLITVGNPDYSVSSDESITLYSETGNKTLEMSDSVRVGVVLANKGRYVKGQNITVEIGFQGRGGNVSKTVVLPSFAYQDTIMVSFVNKKDLEKITVSVDPKHTLKEMDISNNIAELDVNWDAVKGASIFSSANNKDIIPPALTVRFNGIAPKDDGVVNANPILNILLRDDRRLFADTALVEVYLRSCPDGSCEFKKLSFSAAAISIDSLDNYSFRINYPTTGLVAGDYELLVNAKDRAGNFCVQPYQISFKVGESVEGDIEMVVSPNPATSFVRFELSKLSISNQRAVKYSIYNQMGVLIEEKEIQANPKSRNLEWYWAPSSSFAAGLYSYRVIIYGEGNQKLKQLAGKVVVTK